MIHGIFLNEGILEGLGSGVACHEQLGQDLLVALLGMQKNLG